MVSDSDMNFIAIQTLQNKILCFGDFGFIREIDFETKILKDVGKIQE
jgi:hypothetical protein